jgi:hypothetical protein
MPLGDMPVIPSVDVPCVLAFVSLDPGDDEEGNSSGNKYGHNHAILPPEYPLPVILKLLPIAAGPEVGWSCVTGRYAEKYPQDSEGKNRTSQARYTVQAPHTILSTSIGNFSESEGL